MDNNLTTEQLEIQKLREELAQAKAEQLEKDNLIAEQLEQLDLAETQKGKPLPVISHNKKKYQVNAAKFQFGTLEFTAEGLKDHKEVVEKLIEAKSGLLTEIK